MKWAQDLDDTRMKEYFYPELDKSVIVPQEYVAEKSGHTRGSTVDLTLFDMNLEKEVDITMSLVFCFNKKTFEKNN